MPPFDRRPAGVTNIEMFDNYAKGERGPLRFVPLRTGDVTAQLARSR
jgi:hypothetical protein